MRVLIVEPDNQTGHWLYSVTLCRALKDLGIDVRLATFFPYAHVEGIAGTTVSTIGRRIQNPDRVPRNLFRWLHNHGEKVKRLTDVVREFRPAIVHLHGPLGKLDFVYFALMKLLGVRIVYTVHDLHPSPSLWLGLSCRLRLCGADRVVVHSDNGVTAVRAYGVDAAKITQIPHISYHHLVRDGRLPHEDAKAAVNIPVGASAILFFGNIEPRKGLDLLIEAHARLLDRDPDIYLIVAGRPFHGFEHYLDKITKSNLEHRVILDLRYVPFDRMRVYFSAADVVVLPYRRIHQSGVLQWAYAFGRPVVVTNVGGVGQTVAADATGVVAEANDAGSLAEAIFGLLRDGERARQMGLRGIALARGKYSGEAVSERVNAVYRSVLGDGPQGVSVST